jgi:hypothetical protein
MDKSLFASFSSEKEDPAFHAAHIAGATPMMVNILLLPPLVALIGGILILMMPRLLNIIVAVYLIVVGAIGLWPHLLRGWHL